MDFYSSFARLDYPAMQKWYHPQAQFSDPVFPALYGKEILAMWHMLVESGKKSGLVVTFELLHASETQAQGVWKATYSFSGRKVRNVITASMQIENGKIIRHTDAFDFWRWSRMALGPTGYLLGWTNLIRSKVQHTVRDRLDTFISQHPEYK